MTYSNKLLLITFTLLTACVPAKSPLQSGDGATFAVFPDRVNAEAELIGASKATFGRPSAQRLHFTVCLQSLATGQNVATGASFQISDGAGGAFERSAQADGCVRWDEDHAVTPLAPERNVRVERQIKALDNHRGVVTLAFNVKPWLEGKAAVQASLAQEQFAEAIDTRGKLTFKSSYPIDDGKAAAKDLDGRSQLDVADNLIELTFGAVSKADFEVDPFLNLTVPYRYNFSFSPRITRQLFSGALRSDPMSSGRLRVTFVFFASATGKLRADDKYLTSAQIETEVKANGRVADELVIKYPHTLFAGGRQTMLVQITSPDQPELASRSFTGSLSYVDHRGMLTVLDDGRDAETIHRDAMKTRAERAASRTTPYQEYVASHDHVITDINEFPGEATRAEDQSIFGFLRRAMITREELKYALGAGEFSSAGLPGAPSSTIASRLCRAFVSMNDNFDFVRPLRNVRTEYVTVLKEHAGAMGDVFCPDKPTSIQIRRVDFVETISNVAPRNVSIRTYSNMDFATFYTNETVRSDAAGFGIGFRAGTPQKLSASIDAGASRSWLWNKANGGRFGRSQTLAVDEGSMEILAAVRSCVRVTGLVRPFIGQTWLVCDPEVRPARWMPEQFYYFSQMFGSSHSPLMDPYSGQAGMKLMVRGTTRMSDLTFRLEGVDMREVKLDTFINAVPPDLLKVDTLGKLDKLTDQTIPGAFER